jgi:hypothetical protein
MPRLAKYLGYAAALLIIGFALAVALQRSRGFTGFSMGYDVVVIRWVRCTLLNRLDGTIVCDCDVAISLAVFGFALLVGAYKQIRKIRSDGAHFLYSDNIFPVYEYQITPGMVTEPCFLNL